MSDEKENGLPAPVKHTPAPTVANAAEDAASRAADLDYSFPPDDPGAMPIEPETKEPVTGETAAGEALADAARPEDNAQAEGAANASTSAVTPMNDSFPYPEKPASAQESAEEDGEAEDEEDELADAGGDVEKFADDEAGDDETEEDEEQDEDEEEDEPTPGQSLFDHFRELRSRLVRIAIAIVVGFGICWFFHNQIADIVYRPLIQVLPEDGSRSSSIIFTGVAEGFLTHMKLAIVAGIFLMSPFIFYQIWAFIAPGLYDEEKRFVAPVAIGSALCFIAGGCFCYFIVFPNAFRFFMTYSEGPFQAMPSMKEYFGFTMQLMLAFGIIFEMPMFSFFLSKLGIVSAAAMRRFRRYFIVIAFILGAFLTPPDPLSQLLMAGPMILLYELSILIAALAGKKAAPDDDEDEEEEDDEADEGDENEEDDEDEEDTEYAEETAKA